MVYHNNQPFVIVISGVNAMVDNKILRKLSKDLVANPEDYMESFRKNLFMYVDRKDITLSELAEKADISVSTLRSFMYGDSTDCYVSMVVKLAKALGVSCDELLGSGTISPQTCESLQLMRQLPDSFTSFVRWAIHYHYGLLNENKVSIQSVEIMYAEYADNGNLKATNNFYVMDISDLSDDIRPKVFLGIRIPGDSYEPLYYEGDILLVANDRNARNGETVVVTTGDNLWFLKRKEEWENNKKVVNYYSLRNNKKLLSEDSSMFILGYLVKVVRNKEE